MELNEIMANAGCKNFNDTMTRFLGDEDFYLMITAQMLEDEGFEKLEKELREENVKESFEISHSLKGIIGQCGITPMFETIEEIVEPLRAGNAGGLLPAYERLIAQRAEFKKVVNEVTGG